jgi:hypothetical protein
MVALVALWDLSLVLCLLGALALLALIAARAMTARSSRRRLAARKDLLPLIIGGAQASGPAKGAAAVVAMDLTIELAELMRGSDGEAMLRAAETLDVPRHLTRRLRSPVAQERLNAAETLALFDDHAHAAAGALDDRDPAVRLGAALALAHRDVGPGPTEILRRLRAGVEEHSLMLVPLMRDFAARDAAVVEAMVHDESLTDEARLAAIDALADLGHAHVPLIVAVASEHGFAPHLEPRLIAALGHTRHPAARGPIRAALASETVRVRATAAEAAGRAGLVDLAPDLRALLSDADWPVRLSSGQALFALGAAGVNQLFAAAAADEPVARHAATTMLAERALA